MDLIHDLQFAVELARGAGKIALDRFGRVERLTKTNPATTNEAVTEADRASQRHIVAGLKKRFPTDGIVGEESETGTSITFDAPDPAGRVWIIDPIDGTNNFIAGFPAFAICIGLLQRGEPVLGVVFDVCREEVYSAARGHGAWLNTRQLHAAATPMNEGSIVMLTSSLTTKAGDLPGYVGYWLSKSSWKIRMMGSAALEVCQVAAGIAHGALTLNGKLWDVAAPAAVLLEAGGVISDLSGNAIFPFDLRNYYGAKVPFLAAASAAQGTLLREVREYP